MTDEIVIENVDAETVTLENGESAQVLETTQAAAEDEGAWQLTEQEAAVAVVEAASLELAAELQQSAEESAQTDILQGLSAAMDIRLNQIQESVTLATEAQTREIVNLSNTLSNFLNSLNPVTTKKPRRNPAQRAEERRKRSTEKRAARRKA